MSEIPEKLIEAGLCSDCPPVGYPTDETRCEPCPRRHQWRVREFSAVTLECCDVCGMVKNLDQPNAPCRGPVKVGPKSAATLKPLDG